MQKYLPAMYKKNIYDINYDKLSSMGIKCIIFDLDNTLLLIHDENPSFQLIYLIKKLKDKFEIFIISNNTYKRIEQICSILDVKFVSFALKPFGFGFKKILKNSHYDKKEVCVIGDQLMTDILGGNRFGIMSILVDPLGKKDLKITSINRYLEAKKIAQLTKLNKFERGKYYE